MRNLELLYLLAPRSSPTFPFYPRSLFRSPATGNPHIAKWIHSLSLLCPRALRSADLASPLLLVSAIRFTANGSISLAVATTFIFQNI